MKKEHVFSELPIKHKSFARDFTNSYRVYSDATNFIEVQAATAAEAMKLSGLADAVKIERLDVLSPRFLEDGALKEKENQ